MRDKGRLMITGIVALGAVAVTLGGHGISMSIDDESTPEARAAAVSDLAKLRNFDGVTLLGPDDVVVTHGKGFSVRMEGDPEVLGQLALSVKDGTLMVARKGRSDWFGGGHKGDARIHVTLPTLARATLMGSGNMQVDRLDGNHVQAVLNGRGDLSVGGVSAQDIDVNLTGSGDVSVRGKVRKAMLRITGSGDLLARDLDAETASLKLIGSGDIQAHARRDADISIQGSGNAQVEGTTECRISKIGSGEAHCST